MIFGMVFGLSWFLINESSHLLDKGISSTFACVHCLKVAETVSHVLGSCDFAESEWSGFRFKV